MIIKLVFFFLLTLSLSVTGISATGPTRESENDIIEILKQSQKALLSILDTTAEQLGIKNLNNRELCKAWREGFYKVIRETFTVDEEGWIYLGDEGGVAKYFKYDEDCNIHVREVEINIPVTIDTSEVTRAKEIPSSYPSTAGAWTVFSFISFILVVLSSTFLLYGTAEALMRKDLGQAGVRALMFVILVTIGYFLLRML